MDRLDFARSTSGPAPIWFRSFNAEDVFSMDSAESGRTSGNSGIDSIRWPRARTREGTAEAAKAEATANRRWRS
ncbi:unnamed protein product [Victoria cruziana]